MERNIFMLKAGKKDITKLKKEVIINKKGIRQTVYRKLNDIFSFFDISGHEGLMNKLKELYIDHGIRGKYNISQDDFNSHILEYFKNKERWDKRFSEKSISQKNISKKSGSDKDKNRKRIKDEPNPKKQWSMELMKYLHSVYGKNSNENIESQKDSKKSKSPFYGSITWKNFQLLKEIIPDFEKIKVGDSIKLKSPGYMDLSVEGYGQDSNGRMILSIGHFSVQNGDLMSDPRMEIFVDPENEVVKALTYENHYMGIFREVYNNIYDQDKVNLREQIEQNKFLSMWLKNLKEQGHKIDNNDLESMEAPEVDNKINQNEKKSDLKLSKAILAATPDNRSQIEKEIYGITDEEDVKQPKVEFSPVESDLIIPNFNGESKTVKALDYSAMIPKDIYLIDSKKILKESRPSYIPNLDHEWFADNGNLLIAYKVSDNKYIIKTNSLRDFSQIKGEKNISDETFVIVTREVLAATQDYYLKLAKAKELERVQNTTTSYRTKKKSIRILPDYRMTLNQMRMYQEFCNISTNKYSNKELWNLYRDYRAELKQKTEDMEIQLEEYYNTHAKGEETSFGNKGLKDDLLKSYGVLVKRQNGDEITKAEIGQVKDALELVYSVFGNRSNMANKFGLKISHSGDTLMHARKAAGLFFPRYKAIGVTAKYGGKGTGFILAHEFGHFIDFYLGEKENRHYISDDPEHIAGVIAHQFRLNMNKFQKSKYQNRSCECFARALEQYWAIKSGNLDLLSEWDSGNHPTEEIFKEKIMPLIDRFFSENHEYMQKAKLKIFGENSNLVRNKIITDNEWQLIFKTSGKKNLDKLVKKEITNINGNRQTVYVNPEKNKSILSRGKRNPINQKIQSDTKINENKSQEFQAKNIQKQITIKYNEYMKAKGEDKKRARNSLKDIIKGYLNTIISGFAGNDGVNETIYSLDDVRNNSKSRNEFKKKRNKSLNDLNQSVKHGQALLNSQEKKHG